MMAFSLFSASQFKTVNSGGFLSYFQYSCYSSVREKGACAVDFLQFKETDNVWSEIANYNVLLLSIFKFEDAPQGERKKHKRKEREGNEGILTR